MKCKKLSFIKSIFLIFCSTVLLVTSIFLSYSIAVNASDDYDIIDAFEDICAVILVVGGALSIPASGGLSALGYVSVLSGILGLRDNFSNLYDYITDNGDGTYTIDESLIQAALQAAEELEARGFTDSDITNQKTERYVLHYAVTNRNFTCPQHNDSTLCTFEGMISMNGLSAMYISGPDEYGRYIVSISFASNSTKLVEYDKVKFPCGYSYNRGMQGITGHTYGANVPIFSDFTSLQAYLANGTGYKDAENYRPAPLFRRHSSYSPTYTGGSVTVNRTVINNINSKITEVDADDSLSDDQKIEILQEYIRTGVNPTPTPPPTPPDPDYDDNKDIPSGTDLTDTNSWLKKIYLKVCQIYAKMDSAIEEAEQTAHDKILESLDEIISQLKQIKGWTIADTIIDGVDAVADWADFIKDLLTDADSGVATISSTMNGATNLLKTKFPFCIPWDVYALISFLAHEPETPVFRLPVKFERLGIEEYIEVDMSQFKVVSDISRTLLTLIYCYALLNLTMKIFPITKEET